MKKITIQSKQHKQVLDITNQIEELLEGDGLCNLFLTHTSAALTTADLDPGTDLDFLDAIEAISPKLEYRHPHNPDHTNDHIMSSIIGAQINIPYKGGKLVLGDWQRVVLVELNGPRTRDILVSLIDRN